MKDINNGMIVSTTRPQNCHWELSFPILLGIVSDVARIVLLLFGSVAPLEAYCAIPDLFQFYEEEADPRYVGDSITGEFPIKLPETSQLSFNQARFGKGALLINSLPSKMQGIGWESMITAPQWEPFRNEITKMTISAWVRPPSTPLKTFIIFWRLPSDTQHPGFFQFTYLGEGINHLYFAVNGPEVVGNKAEVTHYAVKSLEKAVMEPDEWNHVALTFDKGEIRFYFNGQPLDRPIPTSIALEVIPSVGEYGTPSIKAFADMDDRSYADDFSIFGGRALSEDEIRTIYEKGLSEFLDASTSKIKQ